MPSILLYCLTDRESVCVCVFVPSSVSMTGLIWDNPYNSALCQGWGETLNRVTKRSTAEEPLRSKLKDGQSTYAPPALTAWHFYSAHPEEKEETRERARERGKTRRKMLLSTTCVGWDFINVFNKGAIKVLSLPVWILVAHLRCISVRWESKFSCRLLPATYKLHYWMQ